ncbi:TapB family protein [Marivirga sp.]|uniref:TapB family protein n=1 Tax=Marivirga sp. TaxID=2018662 RepID=UPI003DA7A16B
MKTFIKTLALIFILSMPIKSLAQSDCNPYLLLDEGRKWTTANYNAKDKYQGKQSYEVLSVSEADGIITANVMLTSYDKKDKMVMEKEVEFTCKDGVVEMDMSKYIPEETMESFKNMDVEMEFDAITIPENLEVGQYLEDGGVTMTISGPMQMKMEIKIQDRKVMSKEDIEVPAGTYDTYKINSIIKFDAMITRETKNIEWIAKNVGVVRSEQYDKNGKLNSYTVLTEIK